MNRYKITISYDGTSFVGWQRQAKGLSVQEGVEKAISIFLHKEVKIVGAARTDSGVHAAGQVAHFDTDNDLNSSRFLYGVNALLPRDVRIIDIERVDLTFHSQYSAKSKLYHYHLFLAKEDDPFSHLYHFHYPHFLSLPLLKKGLELFVGTHDFSSFANKGSSAKTFVRTIFRFEFTQKENRLRIECEGNGFLYKMVRNMVGGALDVARGKLSFDELKAILEKKERTMAPPPAPARGLFLINIKY